MQLSASLMRRLHGRLGSRIARTPRMLQTLWNDEGKAGPYSEGLVLRAYSAKKMPTSSPSSPSPSPSPSTKEEFSDRCSLNIVSSPYPHIPPGPYPPLYEFVTENWAPHGGFLSNKKAIVDITTGLERTFTDYFKLARSWAAVFQEELQVAEHTAVAVYAPNHVDYLPIVLAIALCGAKVVPINPVYTHHELEVVLERSRAAVLIAHHTKLSVALQAAGKSSGGGSGSKYVKHVLVLNDVKDADEATDDDTNIPAGTTSLHALRKNYRHGPPSSARQHHHHHHHHDLSNLHASMNPEACHLPGMPQTVHSIHRTTDHHPVLLPYSSGTTGLPKGVCLTHQNLVTNLLQCEAVEDMAFPAHFSLISPLPFYHIYAFTVSMLYAAWKGQTVITQSGRFDLEQFCQAVQTFKPQRAHLVPPILIGLAKHPVVDQYDLSSLRMIISAAAPLGKELEMAVNRRLHTCEVKQAWGMSELSPIGTLNSDFNYKIGSVGPLVPSTFAKIVDAEGQTLGPNQPGELLIKGPQVMMGYLNDPEQTAECLSSSGWLRTGDLAHYDADGYFFITDRVKELIKVRGYQVAPAELEALLNTHEAVNDAAVVQVPDEEAGELPRAYVVLKNTPAAQKVTTAELYEFVKLRVSPFKRLDGGIVLTGAIPKSASGKILRRLLRDQVMAEQQQQPTPAAAPSVKSPTTSQAPK